jgi:isopenicillin N synthase-like dioxygenase|tara:strand:- start:362 stop:1333 length:972 start_codon:yes stop_codon:yes gene_type:complete
MKKNFIPTINISSIINEGFSSKKSLSTINEIKKTLINVGFFQITGHGINKKDISNVTKIANKFFNSSNKNKMKLAPKKWNKKNKNSYRGYFPNNVNGKEGLDIGDLKITKRYASKLKNQYIEYIELNKSINKKSIKILEDYYNQLFILGETLFKSIIKIYKKDIKDSQQVFSRLKTLSTLRFNYYPNQKKPIEISKEDGVALGCETHVDSGIFTILYQDTKGGLQVQNRKTKKWHDAPFNKNALVVNTGLALEFLSKGKFKATNHRVLWNKNKRMSIPFFFEPSYDFKMNYAFLNGKSKSKDNGVIFENFLNKSLKKFIEYQR